MNKVVFIREAVSEDVANNMIALTLYLDSLDKKRIYYWLNCPGGDVSSAVLCLVAHYLLTPQLLIGCFTAWTRSASATDLAVREKTREMLVVILGVLAHANRVRSKCQAAHKSLALCPLMLSCR
jgi:hypothetical protein